MILFLVCFSAGGSFLLSFLLFFHPVQDNMRANRCLAMFVFTLGLAFVNIYLRNSRFEADVLYLSAWVSALQFTSAPLLYLSIRFFMDPAKSFEPTDLLHFLPFIAYTVLMLFFITNGDNNDFNGLWKINDLPPEAYFLPLQGMAYTVISYRRLIRHRANVKLISSAINGIDLGWLKNFLLILLLDFFLWINEIFVNVELLVRLDPFIYTGSIYFLAYFSIKQKSVFSYKRQDLTEISTVFEEAQQHEKPRPKRLSEDQLLALAVQLDTLITRDKIYLDNELDLPGLARKLGIGIHDASFLINAVTGDNFYNFINKHRVEEAKRLLSSGEAATLNMIGIAFAAGFNSKTTFNTTFKKMTGFPPGQFARNQSAK